MLDVFFVELLLHLTVGYMECELATVRPAGL
jgi:hypothetical protein